MRFDTIIIGGGLAGLTAGIRLQRKGRKTAIVSAGQNALHFSSGTFGLLSRLPDGTPVTEPLAAIPQLPESHPYRKIARLPERAAEVPAFFAEAGVTLRGDASRNDLRLTPTGSWMPFWLAMEDVDALEKADIAGKKVLIVNLLGYMDFNTSFIADGLEKQGCTVRIEALRLPEMERLRENPSEMRSVNIARVMDNAWIKAADEVKAHLQGEDIVILPQVFGLKDAAVPARIREAVPAKVLFVGTMPPSVPGMRTQMQLKKAYEAAGGTFLMGDEILSAELADGAVTAVNAKNVGRMTADNYILATGGYFSKGIAANMEKVFEPLFGLDVVSSDGRTSWYDPDFFKAQPFMDFGVATDADFHPLKDGAPVKNLYAIGSVLAGTQALALGCGAGTAILTALSVADQL